MPAPPDGSEPAIVSAVRTRQGYRYTGFVTLFTPAFDTTLGCDAYLVDTQRPARAVHVDMGRNADLADRLVGELMDRTSLMGRSMFDVRGMTFAVFCGARDGRFSVAMTDAEHPGVFSMLRDALKHFGAVEDAGEVTLEESGLDALLAYEEGSVSFFDSAATRPWRALAGKRGLRILSSTLTHDPDPDVEIRECAP